MKRLFKIIIWILFILAITSAGYGYHLVRQPTRKYSVQILKNSNSVIRQTQKRYIQKAQYQNNYTTTIAPNYASALRRNTAVLNQYSIGTVSIPSANIQLPVFAGTSDSALLNGVGTYSPDQRMGKGNYIMMSHNIVSSYALLNPLNQAPIGSKVYLTDFVNIWEYKINFNQQINQNQVQFLENPVNNQPAEVTLFRCDGPIGTKWRWLAKGNLVKKVSLTKAPVKLAKQLHLSVKNNINEVRSQTVQNGYNIQTKHSFDNPIDQTGLLSYYVTTLYPGWVIAFWIFTFLACNFIDWKLVKLKKS